MSSTLSPPPVCMSVGSVQFCLAPPTQKARGPERGDQSNLTPWCRRSAPPNSYQHVSNMWRDHGFDASEAYLKEENVRACRSGGVVWRKSTWAVRRLVADGCVARWRASMIRCYLTWLVSPQAAWRESMSRGLGTVGNHTPVYMQVSLQCGISPIQASPCRMSIVANMDVSFNYTTIYYFTTQKNFFYSDTTK